MGEYLCVSSDAESPLIIKSFGADSNTSKTRWGPGQRNHYILHYVISGSGYFNGHAVFENQGFLIKNNDLHEYHSSKNNPWSYFWINFDGADSLNAISRIGNINKYGIFDFDFSDKLNKLKDQIFTHKSMISNCLALGYFYILLSLHSNSGAQSSNSISKQHVEAAKAYMQINFHNYITISEVASYIYIDPRYMYNLFIKYEGVSPKKYLNNLKISKACELLEKTNLSISEVANSVGYDDSLQFSKFFTSQMKISPSKYKDLHNKSK